MAKPKIEGLILQLENWATGTAYASWTAFTKKNTDHIDIKWTYFIGEEAHGFTDGWSSIGSGMTTATFSVPENAVRIRFEIKPISKKKKKKSYWTATAVTAELKLGNVASKPSTPTVELEKTTLTAKLQNLEERIVDGKTYKVDTVRFQIVANNTSVFKDVKVGVTTTFASLSTTVSAGNIYKVRCKVWGPGFAESAWSDYSENTKAIPKAVSKFTSIKALSSTSVQLDWPAVTGADSYEIEHTEKLENFDRGSVSSVTSETNTKIIDSLESGLSYYFRIRAVSDSYKSAWFPSDPYDKSKAQGIVLGREPSVPTTYALASTIRVGEKATLYWIHNAQDNSTQVCGRIELVFKGTQSGTITERRVINNTKYDDEFDKDDNLFYEIDTSRTYTGIDINGNQFTIDFSDGVTVEWRVQTQGITHVYGPWSVVRKLQINASPYVTAQIASTQITSYPISLAISSGPSNQTPIGYFVEVFAVNDYSYENTFGDVKYVTAGQKVFGTYFNSEERSLQYELTPFTADLEDGQDYTIKLTVVMDSGLSDDYTIDIHLNLNDTELYPNAYIAIDEDYITATITPYCEDRFQDDEGQEAQLVSGVTMSVYRKNVDSEFVEIATGLANDRGTAVVDPHPSLGTVTYRIIATVVATGQSVFYDIDEEVERTGIVITWDEGVSHQIDDEEPDDVGLDRAGPDGNMLILPYNVDVNESHSPDVELVNYIGRKRSVSYYGTHLGESATWKTEIPMDDEESLTLLRILSNYTGDVYVRESNGGTGYWANVKTSYDLNHLAVTVPVTLNITRVEGGA